MEVGQDVVEELFAGDPRFRKLYEEHQLLEKQLNQMDGSSFLSPEQKVERKKIQKMKLAGKDEMEQIIRTGRP
ncbi:MAG: YdcH family protein [Desulfuromonas sp.]|nr:YdcH family protein [Desulfuromonas sp.]